jgi:3-deoxy-D-manno-octulosonic-acid transferase
MRTTLACDIAFVGGSLVALGGQNLLEACALGKPVLIGPHTYNFAEATELALDAERPCGCRIRKISAVRSKRCSATRRGAHAWVRRG